MKDTITKNVFIDVMARKDYGFSYEGSEALFDYLEQYEQDCEKEMEFDPIALRCDFNEYKNLKEIKKEYSHSDIKTLEDLERKTTVIQVPNSDRLIIAAF